MNNDQGQETRFQTARSTERRVELVQIISSDSIIGDFTISVFEKMVSRIA